MPVVSILQPLIDSFAPPMCDCEPFKEILPICNATTHCSQVCSILLVFEDICSTNDMCSCASVHLYQSFCAREKFAGECCSFFDPLYPGCRGGNDTAGASKMLYPERYHSTNSSKKKIESTILSKKIIPSKVESVKDAVRVFAHLESRMEELSSRMDAMNKSEEKTKQKMEEEEVYEKYFRAICWFLFMTTFGTIVVIVVLNILLFCFLNRKRKKHEALLSSMKTRILELGRKWIAQIRSVQERRNAQDAAPLIPNEAEVAVVERASISIGATPPPPNDSIPLITFKK